VSDHPASRAARLDVRPFGPETRDAFFTLHHPANGEGWCFCVAWWVASWEGWGDRSAGDNRALRDQLLAADQYDGYLAFDGERPVGWMQVGPRDRLTRLRALFSLLPDPDAWAITCLLLLPAYRHRGLAHAFLAAVLDDLTRRGVRRVQAFPRVSDSLDAGEVWNGPEVLYRRAGFVLMQAGDRRRVYSKELG
jgi:GNAT superfamily N-acetyltransferase